MRPTPSSIWYPHRHQVRSRPWSRKSHLLRLCVDALCVNEIAKREKKEEEERDIRYCLYLGYNARYPNWPSYLYKLFSFSKKKILKIFIWRCIIFFRWILLVWIRIMRTCKCIHITHLLCIISWKCKIQIRKKKTNSMNEWIKERGEKKSLWEM